MSEEEGKEEEVSVFNFATECFFLSLNFNALAFGSDSELNNIKKEYEGLSKMAN